MSFLFVLFIQTIINKIKEEARDKIQKITK